MNKQKERIKRIFLNTINSDLRYNGSLDSIDYFNLSIKSNEAGNGIHKIMGIYFCMLNYTYESDDSIIMVFAIPAREENGIKQISEKIMKIVEITEKCFIKLDYIKTKYISEENFTYLIIVKKYDKNKEESFQKLELIQENNNEKKSCKESSKTC